MKTLRAVMLFAGLMSLLTVRARSAETADPPPVVPDPPKVRSADCGCKGDCPCSPCRCAKPAAKGIAWRADYNAAVGGAAGRPVLVLYSAADGCPACDEFARGALADKRVIDAAGHFVCIKIDPTTPAGAKQAAAVGLASWPVLTTHAGAGKPTAGSVAGVGKVADVLEAMRQATGEAKATARGSAAPRPFEQRPADSTPAIPARTVVALSSSSAGGTATGPTTTNVSRATRGGFTDGCPPAG